MNVSDNTVRNRIQAMEEEGVIEGYTVEVNYDRAGVKHHFVFVRSARVSRRERLAAQVRDLPRIVEVITLMTGTRNLYVIAAAHEKAEVTDIASDIDAVGLSIESEHLVNEHVRLPHSEFRVPDLRR